MTWPDVNGSQQGTKHDADKPRYDLVPWVAVSVVVKVLTFGAKKYGAENWRGVENWRRRYFAAALRHVFNWWGGERCDPETGLPHLAHAVCCLLFILELESGE